mmetsp:Transcript_44959/g.101776  ORF Transcript_44959/g.101776 Transcript_44959/m.101776 type:complete len:368 (+) Transcript_44959:259-1362(+)
MGVWAWIHPNFPFHSSTLPVVVCPSFSRASSFCPPPQLSPPQPPLPLPPPLPLYIPIIHSMNMAHSLPLPPLPPLPPSAPSPPSVEAGSLARARASCTMTAAASQASSEPRSTTFFLFSPSSTCKSSRPDVSLMFRTVLPPRPMTTRPSSHSISTSFVVVASAELMMDSTAVFAWSTEAFAPRIFTTFSFLSTVMETSCFCSMSRTLPAPFAVSDRMPCTGTFSMVSAWPRLSCTSAMAVLAFSFSASVPVISKNTSRPFRTLCTFAPVEVCTPSRRSAVQSFACSAANLTVAGTVPASLTHSWRITFHLSTLSLSPTSRTPFAFRMTVSPERSRSSANFDNGLPPPLPSSPRPLPLPPPLRKLAPS